MNKNRGCYRSVIAAAMMAAFFAAGAYSQSISGSITGGTVTRGSTGRGVVTMSIPGGLHVNSSRPSSEYAIPTAVRITGAGIKRVVIAYPRGRNRKFDFSETAINVYEGTVRFPFTFSVPASLRGNTLRLRAVVRYQACTNEVCYPPKNKEISINARVL